MNHGFLCEQEEYLIWTCQTQVVIFEYHRNFAFIIIIIINASWISESCLLFWLKENWY